MGMMKYNSSPSHPICSSSTPPPNKKVLKIDVRKPVFTSNPLRCRRAIIKPGNNNDSRLQVVKFGRQKELKSLLLLSMSDDSNQPSTTPTSLIRAVTIQNSFNDICRALENIEENLKARTATLAKIEEARQKFAALKTTTSALSTTDDDDDDLATCIDGLNQMRVH